MQETKYPLISRLLSKFIYEPDTGVLYRKMQTCIKQQPLSISSNGYARVGFDGKRYGAHRICWAMAHGYWPTLDIDHINGIRTDNRLCNLRHVDRSTNLENIRAAKSNNKSSGILGVYVAKNGVITSRIMVKGKDTYLGTFKSIEEAKVAYVNAKKNMHKGFSSANI
jgi:hypothetical protein